MKLPSVYANRIDKPIKNNEEVFHQERGAKVAKKDPKDLKKYFDRNGYANKLVVKLKTENGEKVEKLILYKDTYVITINNERIPLSSILDYEVKEN